MSEKKNETVYDQLTDEQKSVQMPYFVHEAEMTRMGKVNKRLWILLIIIFLAFVGTNVGWIIYESQFETVSVDQDVDTGNGDAYVAGVGDVNYGEGETGN